MTDVSRRALVPSITLQMLQLLEENGVQLDTTQAANIGAGMGELVRQQIVNSSAAQGERCLLCGCPLSNTRCGHSCCCMV